MKLKKLEKTEIILEATLPNVTFGVVASLESKNVKIYKISFNEDGEADVELYRDCEDRHEAIEAFKIAVSESGMLDLQ
jgi:hypothetical protein